MKSDCPFKKTENTASIRSTHKVPPLGENLGPTGRRTSFHPQQQAYSHVHRRPRPRTDRRAERGKHII